jgi:hypothetical protein
MRAQERHRRQSGSIPGFCGLAAALFCLVLVFALPVRASVAVLVEQPYGGLSRINPAGHSAVYLDHVCAESPTKLRACREGELGVVLSRYDDIDQYDWLAMPLVSYLYAVDSPEQIPETMDRAGEILIRDAYRRAHLQAIAPDLEDGKAPPGNWYQLVGSSYDRTIYGFSVKTTPEQDAGLIAAFNDRKNVERYNGAFINCADFVRVTINRFYPHAIHRNFIGDFGITSPKSVARGLAHYSVKHPETGLQVFVIPQVKGEIPRSHAIQGVSESLLKKYGVPLIVLSPTTTAAIFVAYISHDRFAMPKNAPTLDLREAEVRNVGVAKPVVPSGRTVLTKAGAVAPAATATPGTVASPATVNGVTEE